MTEPTLMVRMGRSSTRAALIYQHATRERDEAIAAAMVKHSHQHSGSAHNRLYTSLLYGK